MNDSRAKLRRLFRIVVLIFFSGNPDRRKGGWNFDGDQRHADTNTIYLRVGIIHGRPSLDCTAPRLHSCYGVLYFILTIPLYTYRIGDTYSFLTVFSVNYTHHHRLYLRLLSGQSRIPDHLSPQRSDDGAYLTAARGRNYLPDRAFGILANPENIPGYVAETCQLLLIQAYFPCYEKYPPGRGLGTDSPNYQSDKPGPLESPHMTLM